MLERSRSESGIIIFYSTSEQGYLVLALYRHNSLWFSPFANVTVKWSVENG